MVKDKKAFWSWMVTTALKENSSSYRKNEEKLEEIRLAWNESRNLPRKKKKARRKMLRAEYSILNWSNNLMDEMGFGLMNVLFGHE